MRSPSPATSRTTAPQSSPRRRVAYPTRACWWRPTRPTSPPRRCASCPTSRRSFATRRPSWRSCAAWSSSSSTRPSSATRPASSAGDERRGRRSGAAQPATDAPLRRTPRSRARAELPDRLEHPRGDRARRRAGGRGRGAGDRRGPRRALRAPRPAGRARARDRDRRAPRRCAARRDRSARQHHRALGRRHDDRPRRAEPAAEQGRRKPPLRDRGRGAAAHHRRAPHGRPLGRHGPARGRRAPRRRARQRPLRHALRARPAGLRGAGPAGDPAHRLSPRAQRGLGARGHAQAGRARAAAGLRPRAAARFIARAAAGGLAGAAGARGGGLCAPPQDRGALAGALGRRAGALPRAGARGAGAARLPAGRPRRAPLARGLPCARAAARAMNAHRALAPAKINLGLALGPVRAEDGRHELVTVMQSISLADELTLTLAPAGAAGDEVRCPGVPGPPEANLAAAALAAFRASTGWDAPPLRLSIIKRIPVAAGLAGGSADAAGTLRLARAASGLGDERLLLTLAAGLGADVPAQITPGRWLASGAGEQLHELPAPRPPLEVLVLPLVEALSTAAVYQEADRLGLARGPADLDERRRELAAALQGGAAVPANEGLLHNDLQAAALSLCPEIAAALADVRRSGAVLALVSGSGPTVIGLFPREGAVDAEGRAPVEQAVRRLQGRVPAPSRASTVDNAFGKALSVG